MKQEENTTTILAAQAGNEQAKLDLILLMEDRVMALAHSMADNSNDSVEDGQDISQEIFLAILEALPRWAPSSGNFATFVYRRMRGAAVKAKASTLNAPSINHRSTEKYFAAMDRGDHDVSKALDHIQELHLSEGNFFDIHRALTSTRSVHSEPTPEPDGYDDVGDAFEVSETEQGYEEVTSTMQGEAYIMTLAPRPTDTPRERRACHLRTEIIDMVHGLTSRQPMRREAIADTLGMTRQNVDNHIAKALEIMREAGR